MEFIEGAHDISCTFLLSESVIVTQEMRNSVLSIFSSCNFCSTLFIWRLRTTNINSHLLILQKFYPSTCENYYIAFYLIIQNFYLDKNMFYFAHSSSFLYDSTLFNR